MITFNIYVYVDQAVNQKRIIFYNIWSRLELKLKVIFVKQLLIEAKPELSCNLYYYKCWNLIILSMLYIIAI